MYQNEKKQFRINLIDYHCIPLLFCNTINVSWELFRSLSISNFSFHYENNLKCEEKILDY